MSPPAIPDRDPPALAPTLGLAATTLGLALQVADGTLHPGALLLLTAALALTGVGLLGPGVRRLERLGDRAAVPALTAGVALQLAVLLGAPPGGPAAPLAVRLALVAMGVAAGVATGSGPRKHVAVAALLLAHVGLGAWTLHTLPVPPIDVHVFQRDGCAALLRGDDPYALTFPNVYDHEAFYGPGLCRDGRVQFGFPYPPLSLLLALPGHALGGDHRWSQVVALAVAAGLLAYARPGRLGVLAAALLLLTPRGAFVLEQGWTEPYAVALLALVVFCACRRPGATPYALGLLLAVKQYLLLAAPLALLLLARPWRPAAAARLWGPAALVAAVVSLPLALRDPPAFVRSAVTLQLQQPFRREALSYLAWWARDGRAPPPTALAFVAAAAAIALALRRAPRTPAGFAGALALTLCAFFAFNKQAFCNYYALVIGALCAAVAAADPGPAEGATADEAPPAAGGVTPRT